MKLDTPYSPGTYLRAENLDERRTDVSEGVIVKGTTTPTTKGGDSQKIRGEAEKIAASVMENIGIEVPDEDAVRAKLDELTKTLKKRIAASKNLAHDLLGFVEEFWQGCRTDILEPITNLKQQLEDRLTDELDGWVQETSVLLADDEPATDSQDFKEELTDVLERILAGTPDVELRLKIERLVQKLRFFNPNTQEAKEVRYFVSS